MLSLTSSSETWIPTETHGLGLLSMSRGDMEGIKLWSACRSKEAPLGEYFMQEQKITLYNPIS